MTLSILEKNLGLGRIKQNEPLSRYTTLRVGGKAEYFYIATTPENIASAYKAALEAKIPFTILGGGSNVLISDQGLTGLVVRNEARGIKIVKRLGKIKEGVPVNEQALVEVASGTMINQVVRFTCDEGLSGLERHLGLPGTIGGALFMNSKWTKPVSYVGDVLYQAKIITADGEIKIVGADYFNFGYDQSVLQKTHEIVISATFLLRNEDPKILWERANASMEYRKNTQPMGVASAGCTFRNISQVDAFRIITPNNTTSAGFLVDQVGLKDFQIGKAKFSDKHANFILNLGEATASDIKGLVDEAQKRVEDRYKVKIKPEIVLIGNFDNTSKVNA